MRETFDNRGLNHEVTATVDTGAQQTVCGAERAKKMKITHHPNINNITLQDASGNPMPVIGIGHLYVIPEGGRIPKFIEMAITTSMHMEILISPHRPKEAGHLITKVSKLLQRMGWKWSWTTVHLFNQCRLWLWDWFLQLWWWKHWAYKEICWKHQHKVEI